jgi:acyl-CoA synthetase (AMP-forming)/AMP-acid ligase II
LLYLVGRAKDVIIRGGVNIYPSEIEQVLLAHSAVADAVAVARPHPTLGEEIAAFVVASEDIGQDVLLEHCRSNLASYKVPRDLIFIDELPKTALGKVIKADLISRLGE